MSNFLNENIEVVLNELERRLGSNGGIKRCVRQGSENFENWVQVELVDILDGLIRSDTDNIIVERTGSGNCDIVIEEEGVIKAAIEIKIIRLGGAGNKGDKDAYEKDIQKLNRLAGCEKALLRIAYDSPAPVQREKTWEVLRQRMEKYIGDHGQSAVEKEFDLGYTRCGILKTKMYLYLSLLPACGS